MEIIASATNPVSTRFSGEAEDLLKYAENRLVESVEGTEPISTVQYWKGYRDALRRVVGM